MAVSYASVVAFAVKAASFGALNIFGKRLGGRPAVRGMVGINSLTIRAIRRLLLKPGVTFAKVMLLLGGPDWPTAVLSGILACDLREIFKSLAFLFGVSSLAVAGGAFQIKAVLSDKWMAWAGAIMTIATVVQLGCILASIGVIEDEVRENRAELEAEEIDAVVAQADALAQKKQDELLLSSRWALVPAWARLMLMLSAALMSVGTLVSMLDGASSFVQAVSITEPPCAGAYAETCGDKSALEQIWGLVLPQGRYVLLALSTSVMLAQIVGVYLEKRTVDHDLNRSLAREGSNAESYAS